MRKIHSEILGEEMNDRVESNVVSLKGMQAMLRIQGHDLNPSEVSAALCLSPTRAFRRGDIFKSSSGHHPRAYGSWMLSTGNAIDSEKLVDHSRCLLAWMLPVQEQLKNF